MKEALGCMMDSDEATFRIYAEEVFGMIFELYETKEDETPIYKKMLFHQPEQFVYEVTVPNVKPGMYYVWRIMGADYSYSPAVMDPYAKGIHYIYGEWRNLVIKDQKYEGVKPHIPWQQTIIYELHVGHFTKNDKSCPEKERGTFKALMQKLPYFKALGVTTLELLPIFRWYPYTLKTLSPLTGKLLEDVWGYNTLGFFAVDERFSTDKTSYGALKEFKAFVEAAHKEGIEILLDVVYNHSGEGGKDGVSIHFKRLAPKTYYKYNDSGEYLNCSGTGNTLNTNHPLVKKLIKDSLLYWSQSIGVDGFRFDLASILGQDEKGHWLKESLLNEIGSDPLLSKVKLITESWDAKGSYDVGRMPAPFSEWSDYFRDTMRKFVKGDQGLVSAATNCLIGKEIYFIDSNKAQKWPIHFITAHDGFTMRDLVSYNNKHNEANGEQNRDGHNANYSYNWGVEGDTDDAKINGQRRQIVKNLFALLLLSQGVPMLLMGDELGRSQQGNNNAFCQDNEITWINWQEAKQDSALLTFVTGLIKLRKTLDYFKVPLQYEISWHGIHLKQPDLSYYSRSIACLMEGKESLFLIINNYFEPLQFELPPLNDEKSWIKVLDSSGERPFDEEKIQETALAVRPYSVCLLRRQ